MTYCYVLGNALTFLQYSEWVKVWSKINAHDNTHK